MFEHFNFILLQSGGGQGGSWMQSLILFGGIAIIFYFFMIRPQQKKQKDQKKFIENLQKGDMVVTIGGIHGKVLEISDNDVTLEVDKGLKIKFDKSSISFESSKKFSKAE